MIWLEYHGHSRKKDILGKRDKAREVKDIFNMNL